MLLEPQRGWALAQRIDEVLEMLPAGMGGYVSAETHKAAIELRTDPHQSVATAAAHLQGLRAELAGALTTRGLAAAGAGTHPFALWSETEVTSASRYQLIERTMRDLSGGAGVLISGTNLGGIGPAYPFDPDFEPFEPHAYVVYLAKQ